MTPPAWYTRLPVRSRIALGAGLAAALLPVLVATPYAMNVAATVGVFVVLAAGLHIVVGYCGLLDLGFAAFFAIGAYTSGILATGLDIPLLATLPAVLVVTVVAGVLIGAPTLRLRSDYLAIVTLGFGEIVRLTATNLKITGGPSGVYGIPPVVTDPVALYYLVLAVVALALVGVGRLGRSKLGRAWQYIREDEEAAEATGIRTYRTKLAAYVLGSVWGGVAGVLFAAQLSAISPASFTFLQSALILVAVVLGGMHRVSGVVLAAAFVAAAPELLRSFADARYLVFGVLLVVVMLARQGGWWRSLAGPGGGWRGLAAPDARWRALVAGRRSR
ncbi:branched-chain amino acid ABC transporter permease [Longispora urticae]